MLVSEAESTQIRLELAVFEMRLIRHDIQRIMPWYG